MHNNYQGRGRGIGWGHIFWGGSIDGWGGPCHRAGVYEGGFFTWFL